MTELKDNWIRIIRALLMDPTASLQDIADRTGIPKSTVWYAKERLEEEGLVRILAFPKLDEVNDLKVGLVGGAINGDKHEVLEKVADHPNVWFLVDTIGPHSFTAGIVGRDKDEFQSVIESLRRYGAEGDHYGEVINILKFGLSPQFISGLRATDEGPAEVDANESTAWD